eukprot:352630-Chlamydomonas_euryale.AAC.4
MSVYATSPSFCGDLLVIRVELLFMGRAASLHTGYFASKLHCVSKFESMLKDRRACLPRDRHVSVGMHAHTHACCLAVDDTRPCNRHPGTRPTT